MRVIQGAGAVIDGAADRISGIRVLGPYRLRIRLVKPAGDFTARLTMPFFCPILPNTPAAEIDHPAGSGPYYFAERITNQRTVLERNPFYRGDRPANVDRIVWTPGASLEACLEAIEDDRADLCGEPGAPRTAYRALAEKYGLNRPGGRLFVRPALGAWFIAFNHDRPAFKGRGRSRSRKRSTTRSTGLSSPVRSVASPAGAPTRCSHPRSRVRRASTHSTAPILSLPAAGTGGRASSPRSSSSMHGRSLQP